MIPGVDTFNSRYVEYARAHGNTPEDQLVADRQAWPGGIMAGFQLWMGDRWSDWLREHGRRFDDYLSDADHVAFDAWLAGLPTDGERAHPDWAYRDANGRMLAGPCDTPRCPFMSKPGGARHDGDCEPRS